MRRSRSKTRLALGLALFFFVSLSHSGTDTAGTVTVQTTVSGNCNLVTYPSSGLALGTYDPVTVNRTTPLDATSYTIQIKCVGNSPVRVDIDYGQNASGTQRQLKSGSNLLAYDIYKPTGANNDQCFQGSPAVWGTGSTNGFTPAAMPPNVATTQTYTLCARIAAGLDPAVGSYSDTVSMTVFF